MRIALREVERSASLVVFQALIPPADAPGTLSYATRTGAIASIDGRTAGAFDREHTQIELPPSGRERTLVLRVERSALPTSGLPSKPDIRWWWMLARAHPEPRTFAEWHEDVTLEGAAVREGGGVVLWGHSHLDVAWLWTYADARRKAIRTFANALALIERDDAFVFIQSQPQLYAFVAEDDPALFERVRAQSARGRFDTDVAALWVEPDCNVPSGESLLRQMLHANRFCVDRFGIEPSIAWLPDSFGFARTLPTLLAHAGISFFATTKLQWNDTTRFPYPQFRWRGPDGSEIVSALIDSYDGGPDARRTAIASQRGEPLVVGYGDGGGGPTAGHLREAASLGTWQRPRAWFERLRERSDTLPVYDDELYLEYHRGVYTTHHAGKAANAALERSLDDAEERVAWCVALGTGPEIVARLRESLERAWTIVLRNQFHDVLPGTSIRAVYDDVENEYARADELVEGVRASTRSILPRAPKYERVSERCEPRVEDGEFALDNGLVHVRVTANGTIAELCAAGAPQVSAQMNLLAAYRDRPRQWEAWNLDRDYRKHRVRVAAGRSRVHDAGLEFEFTIGSSPATMRVTLAANEPFVRVDLAVDWRERKTLLRVENWLSVEARSVRYGAPHGTILRSASFDTAAERARYEVPGARFAVASDDVRGVALLALDTYGWSARALSSGGLQLGHSLLRSTTWPDPAADAGAMQLSWAYAPFSQAAPSAIERVWESFARESRVRLFRSEDESVIVVACKPAQDGRGVIVRARECDGASRQLRLRCGARMREAHAVDGLERPVPGPASIDGEVLVSEIPALGLRSFRVLFR